MNIKIFIRVTNLVMLLSSLLMQSAYADADNINKYKKNNSDQSIQLGQRPFYLVDDMQDSKLKSESTTTRRAGGMMKAPKRGC